MTSSLLLHKEDYFHHHKLWKPRSEMCTLKLISKCHPQIWVSTHFERKKNHYARTFSTSSNVSSYWPPSSSTTIGPWWLSEDPTTIRTKTLALNRESCHACVIELCNCTCILLFLCIEEHRWPCFLATATPETISEFPPDAQMHGGPMRLIAATAPAIPA